MSNKRMKYVCLDCFVKIKNKDDYEWHKDVGHKVRLVDPDKFEKDLPEAKFILENEVLKAKAIFKKNPKKYMETIGQEIIKSFDGLKLKELPKNEKK
jgi:hypothetical protein